MVPMSWKLGEERKVEEGIVLTFCPVRRENIVVNKIIDIDRGT